MSNQKNNIKIETFYDQDTYTLTYLVYDCNSKSALVIDPVLDFDAASGKISYTSFKKLTSFIDSNKLNLHMILETHAHADHITSSAELKKVYPHSKIVISKEISKVQEVFKTVFNMQDFKATGEQFDLLVEDNQVFEAGTIKVKTITTPGHTPACVSYLIEDNLFVGDAIFMPDYGTGRCDFPAGSAEDLFHSIHEKLYKLPDTTKVFTGHDYQPNGRELRFESTIIENKKNNIQLKENTSKLEFCTFRKNRDATLSAPKLLLPSIQVNIDAGHFPKAENNNSIYLKLPVTFNKL